MDLDKLHNFGSDEDHAELFEGLERSLSQGKSMLQTPNWAHLLAFSVLVSYEQKREHEAFHQRQGSPLRKHQRNDEAWY